MKKRAVILFILISGSVLFAQEEYSDQWNGTIRFKPVATIVGVLAGIPEIIVDWVPYISTNIGIPIEMDVAIYQGFFFGGFLSGIESTLFGQKEKCGLYISALGGLYFILGYPIFALKTDIGYQWVSNNGFVFTPAVGLKYNAATGSSFDLMIDIGFAYKRR
jgi:hypothetical protein